MKGCVRYESDNSANSILEITVSDNGIGMSNDEASKVFDEIFQTQNQESRRMNPYGNGIGLSLCRQICRSLDGEI